MGGVVRGIFSAKDAAEAYFDEVKAAVDEEGSKKSAMLLKVDVENGL